MSATNKKSTKTKSGPKTKVGKRAQPKARDVKVQLKQLPDKISYTLHLNDTPLIVVSTPEAKTKDGQVVKMNVKKDKKGAKSAAGGKGGKAGGPTPKPKK